MDIVSDNLSMPRGHILTSRWALTWKSVGDTNQPNARLCVLGFQDPRLATMET